MIRYVPPFILYNQERNKLHGSFPGFVLFIDLVDFTHTCDLLQKEGKGGAEEISRLLQTVFQEPLTQVEKYGGYVISFVGDALLAVFREKAGQNILAASLAIREHFKHNTGFPTPFGSFPLKIRQLVSFGKISWRIFENALQNEYVFRGRVLQELQMLAKYRRGLVFTEEAVWKIGRLHFAKKGKGFEPFTSGLVIHPVKQEYSHDPKTANSFLHKRFRQVKPENEIRQVVCCFASLEQIGYDERGEAVTEIQELAYKYGGFVNKLIYGEKGLKAVILFGIPRIEGDIYSKACHFALEALQAKPLLSLGISSGKLFTGFIGTEKTKEYAALGHPMNLAARLVEIAKPGEIITSGDILRLCGKTFVFEHHSTCRLRGIGFDVRSYKLIKVLAGYVKSKPDKFIGREKEKALLRKIIKDTFTEGKNNFVYIRGEEGVGKTRLVNEVLHGFYNNKHYIMSMQCDLLEPKPLLPDRRFIRSFFGLEETEMNPAGFPIFHKKWTIWAENDQQLLSIEPLIASFLNLISSEELNKNYPVWSAPDQRLTGWLTFMRGLATRKHLILHFDDFQRIDTRSLNYLIDLARAGITPVCVLISYTPLINQESINLDLENFTAHELELKPLSVDDSLNLYKLLLGLPHLAPDTEAEIRASTQGNPSQIMRVCSGMLKAGLVTPDGDFLLNRDTGDIAGVTDILSQFFDRLDADIRDCIITASVLGMSFNVRILAEMIGHDPRAALLFGVQHRIWREEEEDHYIFMHVLNHEVAYRRLMSDRLTDLHLKAAQAMEKVFAEDLFERAEEIALHYEQAGLPDKASFYRDLAAKYAARKASGDIAKANVDLAADLQTASQMSTKPNTATTKKRKVTKKTVTSKKQ